MDLLHSYKATHKCYINDVNNSNYINNKINKIYVINLESDIIRRRYIECIMYKYEINFELVTFPILTDTEYENVNRLCERKIKKGEAGCYMSHMYCLKKAIDNNYSNIIIFEDDIILHKDFNKRIEDILTQYEYNILILGIFDYQYNSLNAKNVNKQYNNVYIPDDLSLRFEGTFGIYYNRLGIHKMFKHRLLAPTFFDNNLIKLKNLVYNNFYICSPNLLISDTSTSNLGHYTLLTNNLKYEKFVKTCYIKLDYSEYNCISFNVLNNLILNMDISLEDNIKAFILTKNNINNNNNNEIMRNLAYNFFTINDILYILGKINYLVKI